VARKPKSPSRRKSPEFESREEELFFQEVNEELKQERAERIWKKYGNHIIGGVLIVVVGVFAWQYWSDQRKAERDNLSEAFHVASAQAQQGEIVDATQRFIEISRNAEGGYATLARIRAAGLLARSNDRDGALDLYKQVADDNDAPSGLRSYATLMWALTGLESLEPDEVRPRLQSMAGDDNPWRFTAREMLALYANKAGETAEARRMFGELAAAEEAPRSLRLRAREMYEILGGAGDEG
jgi:hypothetical protein